MNKKNTLTGFIIGLITNAIGLFIAAKLLGKGDSFMEVMRTASNQGFLGKLISLGAILNLIAFFYFINKKQDSRARGVLIATILVTIFTLIFKFL